LSHPSRPEIEKFAAEAFAVATDDIIVEHAEKRKRLSAQVRLTGNSGGYLPFLVLLEAEHVREMIRAKAKALVEAFTLYGVPSDRRAELDLQTAAKQMAGGAISGIRGELQLRSVRLSIAEEGGGVPWHLEIEKAMNTALKKGVLRLKRQRIKATTTKTQPAVTPRSQPGSSNPPGPTEGLEAAAPPQHPERVAAIPADANRSANVMNVGALMGRLGKDWNWEFSPEALRAFQDIQAISAKGYERILHIAATMQTREGFISRLPELFAEMGLKVPSGVLNPPPGRPGRPRKSSTQRVHEIWISLGRPGPGSNKLAAECYGKEFRSASPKARKLMVDQCYRAVKRMESTKSALK
jgi:hypothetical protein